MRQFQNGDIVTVTYRSASTYGGRITDIAQVTESSQSTNEVKLSGFEHIGWINLDYGISSYFIQHATDDEKKVYEENRKAAKI